MRARYLGPFIVLSRNHRGAYIISELDGSVFDCPFAAFRIIPFFAHERLDLPPLDTLLDVSRACLTQMEKSTVADPDEEDEEPEPLEDD